MGKISNPGTPGQHRDADIAQESISYNRYQNPDQLTNDAEVAYQISAFYAPEVRGDAMMTQRLASADRSR